MANTMQGDNIDVINSYIMRTTAINSEAKRLKDDWIIWFNDLAWYEKDLSLDTFDKARNKRNAFNLANTQTAEQKAAVENVIAKGLTAEEQAGRASRLNSEGKFPETKEPLIPTKYKIGVAVGAGAIGTIVGLKKLRVI